MLHKFQAHVFSMLHVQKLHVIPSDYELSAKDRKRPLKFEQVIIIKMLFRLILVLLIAKQ